MFRAVVSTSIQCLNICFQTTHVCGFSQIIKVLLLGIKKKNPFLFSLVVSLLNAELFGSSFLLLWMQAFPCLVTGVLFWRGGSYGFVHTSQLLTAPLDGWDSLLRRGLVTHVSFPPPYAPLIKTPIPQ